ncbi:MAG: DUF2955 domain-containing protein [Pseudomonadales bacterium]|jgi:hypothetical protein|nr:DUF2955 domain-containing protein [Pseudomonadales bacterium]
MRTDDAAVAQRRVLRLAFGTAGCLCFSQAIGWPMSYISAVLAMTMLSLPLPRPSLKTSALAMLAVIVPIYASIWLLLPALLHYRAAGLLLLLLVLFHAFHFTARGGAALVGTLITISVTLTLAVGSVSVDAVLGVAAGLSAGAIVGVLFVWMAHALLPDPPSSLPSAAAPPAPADAQEALRCAVRSVAVVMPIIVWFMLSVASIGAIPVLIKVAAMGQESGLQGTRLAARSLIASTLIGGSGAVIAWQILSIWPSLPLYTLLVILAGLLMGPRIFEGRGLHPQAPTWSYGFLTMIVILAPAALDGQLGSAAGAAFMSRLLMFAGATLYAVAAVYVFDAFWPARATTHRDVTAPQGAGSGGV